MKAIVADKHGGPEVMQLKELPTPSPGPATALVRLEACGVNFIDTYQRSGAYPTPLPFPVGLEGAGVVEQVGAGVTDVKPGDRVAWTGIMGSYATHNVVPVERLVPVPAGVDAKTAAALMLQGMTAHYLTQTIYPLKKGDTCLVHAAAGGVGLLATQMAKRAGARVIGTVSTEEKAALAREAGADEVILYTKQDFESETRRLTGGAGVQVVYDSVGKTTFDKSLGSLAVRGMLVLFGQASGPVPPFDCAVLVQKGSLFLTRPTLVNYIAAREELLVRARDVLGWAQTGALKVRIGATFPLADAPAAHRALEGRETTGKVLLLP